MDGSLLIFQLAYGIPSVIAYIILIIFLYINKDRLSDSYYRVVRYTGVTHLFIYFSFLLILRLQTVPEFTQFYADLYWNYPWATNIIWILFANIHVASFPFILSGVQRLQLLSKPTSDQAMFNDVTSAMFLLLPIFSLVLTSCIPMEKHTVVVLNKGGIQMLEWRIFHNSDMFPIMCATGVIHLTANIIIFIMSIVYLFKFKYPAKHVKRMFMISFLTGFIQTIFIGLLTYVALANDFNVGNNGSLKEIVFYFVLDLSCLLTPWLQFIGNRRVRRQFLQQLGIVFKKSNTVNVIGSFNPN